jgi:tetratricopeptide (TPR) repeat protein
MKQLQYFENLLDDNKPAEVVKELAGYKGGDAMLCFILAEARRMLGNFEKAITLYNKAIKVYKAKTANADYMTTIMDMNLALAKCHRTLGNAKKAGDLAHLVWHAAEINNLEDFKIQAMQEFALALRAGGELSKSKEILKEVLSYYKKEKDFGGEGFIYWALGGIARLEGDFSGGVKYFELSINLAKKIKDKISEAYGYCGLAGISRIAGDITGCVLNYKKAEGLFKNTDDIFGKAYTNCGMANGLRQLGKCEEALKRYDLADKLYCGINDKVDLGFVKWGRADILRRQNKLPAALAELRKSQKLFAGSDETRGQLLTAFARSQVLYALGRRAEAIRTYNAALTRARSEDLHTYLEVYT